MSVELAFHSYGRTRKSKVNKKNHDFFLTDNNSGIFIVADGLGGHNKGEYSSSIICKEMHRIILETLVLSKGKEIDYQSLLNRALKHAHHHLLKIQCEFENLKNMSSTTALAVWEHPKSIHIVNVGDCRIYHKAMEVFKILTKDKNEGLDKPKYGLGANLDQAEHYEHIKLETDDHILLCTDGLWKVIDEKKMKSQLSTEVNPVNICKKLIKNASELGSMDDITAVAINIYKSNLTGTKIINLQMTREWIIAYLLGDEQAYDKLYKEYNGSILAYFLTRCKLPKDEPLIQDGIQKCWNKITEKLSTYNPDYSFRTFAKIWAEYAVKDIFEQLRKSKRNIEIEQSGLSNILPTSNAVFSPSDDYFIALLALVTAKKLPHEIIVFGFYKLLDYDITEIDEVLSMIRLSDLLTRLMNEYEKESHIPTVELKPYFDIMDRKMGVFVEDLLVHEPKGFYSRIINEPVGQTTIFDYYGKDKHHNISLWIDRVRKAALTEFKNIKNGKNQSLK